MKIVLGAIAFLIVVQSANICLQFAADKQIPITEQWEAQLYKGTR